MTVLSEESRKEYVGNGTLDTYVYTWQIYTKDDNKVYVAGVLKTVDIHYTVTGVLNPAGGNIIFTAGNIPANLASIVIYLDLPLTQGIDYKETDKFPAETHEKGLDRLTKIVQSLKEKLYRCLKLPSYSVGSGELPTDFIPNYFMKVNSTGTGFELHAGLPFTGSPAGSNKEIQFDDNGVLGADPDLTWDKTTERLYAKDLMVKGPWVDARAYGAVGDGVTDDTTAVQNALTAVATAGYGATLFIPPGVFIVDDINVTNGHDFNIFCMGTLKLKHAVVATHNVLRLTTCYNMTLDIRADGNVANNGTPVSQHLHLLKMDGCYNASVSLFGKNLAGDGLYLTGGCHDINSPHLLCYNGGDYGRNVLSIIKASRINFNNIIGYRVGHTTMPGGIDIEPDVVEDLNEDINFNNVIIYTAGGGGFQLYNGVAATLRRIKAKNIQLEKSAGCASGATGLNVKNATDCEISIRVQSNLSANDSFAILTTCTNLTLEIYAQNAHNGINIIESTGGKIFGKIEDIGGNGVDFISGTSARLTLDRLTIENCNVDAGGTGSCIYLRDAATVNDLTINDCNLSKVGSTVFALGRTAGVYARWSVIDCNLTGYGATDPICGFANAVGLLQMSYFNAPVVFADGDTTPSVGIMGGNAARSVPMYFGCANTDPTTITLFHNGISGQLIVVRIDNKTTIQNNANMLLAGGANFTGDSNDIITLVCIVTDSWREVSRSVN